MSANQMEPWRWPEAHWRGIVGHVRAGRALRPAAWKDGARCAVALSFDSDHETNELRDGGEERVPERKRVARMQAAVHELVHPPQRQRAAI